jgi:hypothetical protein
MKFLTSANLLSFNSALNRLSFFPEASQNFVIVLMYLYDP